MVRNSPSLSSRRNAAYSLVRKLVRATHRWPLLGSIYTGVYKAAADSVARLAEQNSGIAGIYARNSYALGTWEPGRSDIDLTVTWHHPTEETTGRFHLAYAELQRCFPMLGEVEMIDDRHLDAWMSHRLSGLHSQDWKTLAGDHKPPCQYKGSEYLDRVRHAVAVYRYEFLKYFWQRPRRELTAQRAAAKVMRALRQAPPDQSSADGLLASCLRQISREITATPLPVDEPLVDYESLIGRMARPTFRRDVERRATNGVLAALASAQGSTPCHVLVDGEFDPTEIEAAFPEALIWDRTTFRFYLCFVDPLEYFALLRERVILHGEDPLREVFMVPETALRETICHYSIDMLTYPYRADLTALPAREFRNLLYGWFLRTLRYFEEGVVDFDYCLLRRYFGSRHLEGLNRFSLLHGIAEELSHHLCFDSCSVTSQTSSGIS